MRDAGTLIHLSQTFYLFVQNYQKRSKNYLTANYANYANFFGGSTIIDNLRQLKSPNGKLGQEKRYVYQRSGLYSVRRSL